VVVGPVLVVVADGGGGVDPDGMLPSDEPLFLLSGRLSSPEMEPVVLLPTGSRVPQRMELWVLVVTEGARAPDVAVGSDDLDETLDGAESRRTSLTKAVNADGGVVARRAESPKNSLDVGGELLHTKNSSNNKTTYISG
jgi:hypothetical protein